MSKSKIFFWLLIAFIAGVGLASFVPLGIPVVAAIFMLGGAAAAFGLGTTRPPLAVAAGGMVIMLAFGAFWFERRTQPQRSPLRGVLGQRIALEGVVADEPVRHSQRQTFTMQTSADEGAGLGVITRPFPAYRYGDRLRLTGRLEESGGRAQDPPFRMAFPEVTLLARGGGHLLYRALFGLKERFSTLLTRHLPEPQGAFLSGLLLGERQNFSAELRRDLQITGTTHLVALSGYNITIVADALFKAFTFLWIPLGAAWWLAVAGIVGFTLLTGAAASVVRAAIMGLLVLVARRAGRLYHMQNALALAAALMLAHEPTLLRFDIGFQLSFAATLGLVYGAPLLEGWYGQMRMRLALAARDFKFIRERRGERKERAEGQPGPSFVRTIVIATLAAQLAVLPLVVFYFGRISFVAPLANLAVLPFIPLTMLAGFLTGAGGFVSDWLDRIGALISQVLAGYEIAAIRWFAAWPHASSELRGVVPAGVMLAYLAMAFLVWRAGRRHVEG